MRTGIVAAMLIGLAGAAAAQTPTLGPNPGRTATDRILDPAKPTTVVPADVPRATGPMSNDEMRAVLDAARETAKATREAVDYGRVVPDILTQVLTKLDKIEDKLDRIDTTLKQGGRRR